MAEKYGWSVGGLVEVLELKRGILIRKAGDENEQGQRSAE